MYSIRWIWAIVRMCVQYFFINPIECDVATTSVFAVWSERVNFERTSFPFQLNAYTRLSSPSTSPITLLAKSTRLPWRRISFQWITFISLIMHKEYLSALSNTEGCQFPQIILASYTHHIARNARNEYVRTRKTERNSGFTRSLTIFSINCLKNVLIRIKSIKIYKYGESYVFAHFSLTHTHAHSGDMLNAAENAAA